MTAFLSCWADEELWHGEALGEVLAAHGRPSGTARVGDLRHRLGWRDRIRPFISLWRPVGSGIMPPAETDFIVRHLFGGPEGAPFVERIDRRIHALPGLDGLHLIDGAVGQRSGPVEMSHRQVVAA